MTSHVVSALVEKRAELAGQIEATEGRLRAMHEDLAHLDGALRLFDPAIRPERIKAKRERALPVIKDLYRYVLDALRMADAPVSSREMARVVMARLSIPASALEPMDRAINSYVRRQDGRLVEKVGDTRPARWRIRVEVE